MDIKSKVVDNVLYIMLKGELDECTASFTRNYLDECFLNSSFSNVVLELSELDFMDSTGIGVLLGRYKKLKSKNKSIYISNPSATIEKIFKMSGIYTIMPKIS
ncbi:MAG: STAS domain-containing protein [Clostridiales bacterium]|nr:STAS domain-containing protein [Clostridiales bacterium]